MQLCCRYAAFAAAASLEIEGKAVAALRRWRARTLAT